MILDCQAAICLVNENARFTNAIVGLGKTDSKTFFMVVNRASTCDKFKLERGDVRLMNSTFEFRNPSKMIHLREYDQNKFKEFCALVGHILSKHYKLTAKLPRLDKIMNLKPNIKNFSLNSSKTIPNRNFEWSRLKQFTVNGQKHIPPQIFSPQNVLTHLTINDCSLLSIPSSIKTLRKTLQFLNLSGNQISVIPMWFCRTFKKVQHLDLSHNRLRIIPQEMILLKSCQSLFLNFNNIRFIHDRFLATFLRGKTQFSLINISNNQLAYLKLQLLEIRPETEIDLSHNKFASAQKLVANMKHHLPDDLSLQNIVLKYTVKNSDLFASLFDTTQTSFPVYFSFQNQSFICEDCKQLRLHTRQDDHFCRRYPFKHCGPPPNLAYTPDIRHLTYLVGKCCDCFRKNPRCVCDPDILSLD